MTVARKRSTVIPLSSNRSEHETTHCSFSDFDVCGRRASGAGFPQATLLLRRRLRLRSCNAQTCNARCRALPDLSTRLFACHNGRAIHRADGASQRVRLRLYSMLSGARDRSGPRGPGARASSCCLTAFFVGRPATLAFLPASFLIVDQRF